MAANPKIHIAIGLQDGRTVYCLVIDGVQSEQSFETAKEAVLERDRLLGCFPDKTRG